MNSKTRIVLAAGLSSIVALGASCSPDAGKGGAPPPPDGRPASKGAGPAPAAKTIIRFGHFPNVTHAQALVAHHFSRLAAAGTRPKGWFEERLGDNVEIQWFTYNAGPSAMEAIFTGSLDLTYVGPNPALNAFAKSQGKEIRVLAGSALGGGALVVQPDGRIQKPEDFKGRKIATPQLGNTQDVSCRAWLGAQGFKVTQQGGDVFVVPTSNPDQLALFANGELDAVWTVEPWVSRLEIEAKGKVYLEETDSLTTILVSSVKLLRDQRELARKLQQAHVELTAWIIANPDEAKKLLNAEIKEETGRAIPAEIVDKAWSRLKFTSDIKTSDFENFAKSAQSVGFLTDLVSLSTLVEAP